MQIKGVNETFDQEVVSNFSVVRLKIYGNVGQIYIALMTEVKLIPILFF